jgi:uncharacterized Zn finger protein (UPF0148 family)
MGNENMTDDIDASYRIQQMQPLKSGKCPVCGMWTMGNVTCPFCNGERKVVKKPRRWVGKVELE